MNYSPLFYSIDEVVIRKFCARREEKIVANNNVPEKLKKKIIIR